MVTIERPGGRRAVAIFGKNENRFFSLKVAESPQFGLELRKETLLRCLFAVFIVLLRKRKMKYINSVSASH